MLVIMLAAMTPLLTLAIALTLSFHQTWALPSPQQHAQQTYLANNNIHIRPATEADLDDITTVVIDAFAPGPAWHYAFPHQDEYKEYQWRCLRKAVEQEFARKPNNTFVNVISVPVGPSAAATTMQGERAERVVAVAVWKILEPDKRQSESGSMDLLGFGVHSGKQKCSDNLDTNMTRAEDFNRQFSVAEEHYVIDFPHKQMHLGLLCTHPDWDGHGFGAAHCEWGMDLAKSMDVPVTLVATPAGWPLYDLLGFESVANITIKTLDEPEDLWFEYMRYEI